jgi:hypothetical protein
LPVVDQFLPLLQLVLHNLLAADCFSQLLLQDLKRGRLRRSLPVSPGQFFKLVFELPVGLLQGLDVLLDVLVDLF